VSRSAAHAAHAHQELPEAIIQPRDVSEHPHPRMVWTIEPMRPCSIGEGSKLYAAEGAVSSDRLQSATTGPSFARIDLKIAHPASPVLGGCQPPKHSRRCRTSGGGYRKWPESGSGEKASGSTPTVFVSYASQDAVVANSVVEALEQHTIRCWIAPRNVTPGAARAEHDRCRDHAVRPGQIDRDSMTCEF